MARRFTEVRALLDDLLDRYEAGTETPVAYPDHAAFATVGLADGFEREIRKAENVGAVRLGHGTGRRRGEIKLVRLQDASALYAFLRRQPAPDLAARALQAAISGLDLDPRLLETARQAAESWGRGKTWCAIGVERAEALRTSLILAQAIVARQHIGQDYRTFSRRIAGDSKALERLEAAVLRLVGAVTDVPPDAAPRAALAALGLERFAPPLLLAGDVALDGVGSVRGLLYVGLSPGEVGRLRFPARLAYVLTIENFASFNRYVREADPDRRGLTLYVGGYPSLGTQRALGVISAALPPDVPFFHWSDIDPDGIWIFATIETALARPLLPHLMSRQIAERYGRLPQGQQAFKPSVGYGVHIADLAAYLATPGAKHLEQEEIDPTPPAIASGTFHRHVALHSNSVDDAGAAPGRGERGLGRA